VSADLIDGTPISRITRIESLDGHRPVAGAREAEDASPASQLTM
jgi:hypothetical protein